VESGEVGPTTLRLRDMEARVERVGDLWGEMHAKGQGVGGAVERVRAALGG
jgi:hypothetical protein